MLIVKVFVILFMVVPPVIMTSPPPAVVATVVGVVEKLEPQKGSAGKYLVAL